MVAMRVVVGQYEPPALGASVLAFGPGGATTVGLDGGNLAAPLAADATMTANIATSVTPPLTALKFSAPYGVLSATFLHPLDGKKRTVWGIALQNRNEAFGGFIGTDQTGPATVNAP